MNRKPNRMQGYDYSKDNLFFVTSCVQNRFCCFGEITVGNGRDHSLFCEMDADCDLPVQKMILNEYGKIAEKQWFWLGEQYPYVVLHAFVVMPDHIHGIIEINHSNALEPIRAVGMGRDPSLREPSQPIKIKSLSELMGAYKTTVSKQIHLLQCGGGGRDSRDRSRPIPTIPTTTKFAWQRSFHYHIIRTENEFENISNYIINNPVNWKRKK